MRGAARALLYPHTFRSIPEWYRPAEKLTSEALTPTYSRRTSTRPSGISAGIGTSTISVTFLKSSDSLATTIRRYEAGTAPAGAERGPVATAA